MTRTLRLLIAVVVVILLAFAVAGNTVASVDPQVVDVTLTDSQLNLSQFSVASGKTVRFVVDNQGTMAHQLRIEPYAGSTAENIVNEPVVAPNTSRTFDLTLNPGVYRIECALWDHAERGMTNAIVVNTAQSRTFPIQMDLIIPLMALVAGCIFIIGDTMGLRLTQTTKD
ncbi:MAG: cupredoxin domain-containing protein [Chloroflexi bacterium]|nr:cupredoxin domain-containing protein [Chloroflexota bacterium]